MPEPKQAFIIAYKVLFGPLNFQNYEVHKLFLIHKSNQPWIFHYNNEKRTNVYTVSLIITIPAFYTRIFMNFFKHGKLQLIAFANIAASALPVIFFWRVCEIMLDFMYRLCDFS